MSVKNIFFYLIFFLGLSFPAVGQNKDLSGNKEFNALKIRGGLPNFFSKALHGDSIKIAYLGGSITAQNGWRITSLAWFKQRFPKAKFSEVNAAIGGTGSEFGVFRLHDHVLKFNPDLVFVEFAVNDSESPSDQIIRSTEGIIRQILQQNPQTDICFVYTIKESFLEQEQNGELPYSAVTMEKVAAHYNIPGINFGFEVSRLVKDKQLIFKGPTTEINGVKVFSADGVHPYEETGHAIYQEVLKRSFETLASLKQSKSIKHLLPKPLSPDYFSNTKMLDISKTMLSKNWEILNIKDQPQFSDFSRYLNSYGKTTQSGETLTVHFKGKAIGIYDFMGPDAGKVIVEIDGKIKDTISRFDAFCTYRRMNYFLIDHLADQNHTAVFRVLSEPFDKAAILAKRGEVIRDPNDYKEYNWYVGKILMDGNIQS